MGLLDMAGDFAEYLKRSGQNLSELPGAALSGPLAALPGAVGNALQAVNDNLAVPYLQRQNQLLSQDYSQQPIMGVGQGGELTGRLPALAELLAPYLGTAVPGGVRASMPKPIPQIEHPLPEAVTSPQIVAETTMNADRWPLASPANPRLTDNSFRGFGSPVSTRYGEPSEFGPGHTWADTDPVRRWSEQQATNDPTAFLRPGYGENPMGLPHSIAENLSQYRPGSPEWNQWLDYYRDATGYRLQQLQGYVNQPIRSRPLTFTPYTVTNDIDNLQTTMNNLDRLAGGKSSTESGGQTYVSTVNHNPEHFWDWSAPLEQQSDHVRAAIERLGGMEPSTTGEQMLSGLGNPTQAAIPLSEAHGLAADRLRSVGIPGTKYAANPFFPAQTGNMNYVVFDPKMISIIRKLGLTGLISGGAMSIGGDADAATHLIPVPHDPFDPERQDNR